MPCAYWPAETARPHIFAAAEEVGLGDRHFRRESLGRRIAAGDREIAGGLFFNVDVDDDAIRRGAGSLVILTFLKKPSEFRRRSARSISALL